jgi:hypothetical protein
MHPTFPEHEELLRILEAGERHLRIVQAGESHDGEAGIPVYAITLGSEDRTRPAAGFFGGVHGLERIGSHVVLSFLGALVARLGWDENLHRQLEHVCLVFMPLVNPAGMRRGTRANGSGVDLMRNAPVQSGERVAFLAGGHRWTPHLPWYRGPAGQAMQPEAQALCDVVERELLARPFSVALDCHSGFGLRDRIWFPHSHKHSAFPHVAEVNALREMFEGEHPGHPYVFEPQSRQYLTHGDLWDYLYERVRPRSIFLPLTLEMGSWRWIRKSPRQLLHRLGIFNPIPLDRAERVRRNHVPWLDFLCRAAASHAQWLPIGRERDRHQRRGLRNWYR